MWTHRCAHINKDGTQCKRASTSGVWAFKHQGEHFDNATWDEYCAWHVGDAEQCLSQIQIHKVSHA